MRYVILGAGAVGGVIGGRLHAVGRHVVLVARGAHLDALRADGLDLRTPDGPERHHIQAVGRPAEADLRPDDVVIMTVKSQDAGAALDDLASTAPPDLAVVCAQNGVANEHAALRRFGHVYGMCVILPAAHLSPGVVVQYSAPSAGVLDLGRYPSGTDDRAVAIAADLVAAGFRSDADPAIMRAKHRKLVMNLGNALDALCDSMGARGSVLNRLAQEEATACFAAAGVESQSPEEERARRDGAVSMQPVDGKAHSGSSSWQSLARGTGSIETDWLNGEIVLLGRLHGVPTPVNALLQREANAAARAGRRPGSVTIADLEEKLAATHR